MASTNSFTEPTIITNDDLSHRSLVGFTFNDEPQRLYHGKKLGQSINPNRATTPEEKIRLLKKLQFEAHKALESNNYPYKEDTTAKGIDPDLDAISTPKTAIRSMFEAVRTKMKSDLSKTYKRDLKCVYREFRAFLTPEELTGAILNISLPRIEQFLAQFGSSGTYYMNKRRNLSVVMTSAARLINIDLKVMKETKRRKSKAKLHKAYDKQQLKPILNFLETHYPKLHVCCLLTYSSWLRPHEEIRLLIQDNFKRDCSEVHLSGDENKGGKVLVVYVPDYTQAAVKPMLTAITRKANIFTGTEEPLNESYFNTAWSRAYKRMYKLCMIYENQTIYSFRHTAAIETYRKTKDVYLLQKLLGHSSIMVTLKYLRSLGEFNTDELREAAPEL